MRQKQTKMRLHHYEKLIENSANPGCHRLSIFSSDQQSKPPNFYRCVKTELEVSIREKR